MTTRVIVIASCIAVILAAITIVAVNWPKLPPTTLPTHHYVAMGGQAVGVATTGCLAPMVSELQKRPNWTLRIDDMRWTDYTDEDHDPRHAQIFLDATGAIWRDEDLHAQTLPLTADEQRELVRAFDLGCETDESLNTGAYEGRYLAIAYGKTEPPAAKLRYHSPVVVRIGELFDSLRGRYIDNRIEATKSFVLKLAWKKHQVVIDSSKLEVDLAEGVTFVDWAMTLPSSLKGPKIATGTFTLAGVTRHVAMQLDDDDPTEEILGKLRIAEPLRMLMLNARQ